MPRATRRASKPSTASSLGMLLTLWFQYHRCTRGLLPVQLELSLGNTENFLYGWYKGINHYGWVAKTIYVLPRRSLCAAHG